MPGRDAPPPPLARAGIDRAAHSIAQGHDIAQAEIEPLRADRSTERET